MSNCWCCNFLSTSNQYFGHKPFKGEFIGVDIFFVISGYLIISNILKELVTTGSFSFKNIYVKINKDIYDASYKNKS